MYDDIDDDELDDIVGAVLRRRPSKRSAMVRRSGGRSRARSMAKRAPSYLKTKPRAGAGAEFPLGFSTFQFVNGGVTSAILTATPQRRGKPNRLTAIAARSAATASGLLTITDLKVGTLSQLVSNDPIPYDMFAADAVGTGLEIAEVGPGIEVAILVSLSAAPPVGETIDISAALICDVLD